jgi:hypothetical protein
MGLMNEKDFTQFLKMFLTMKIANSIFVLLSVVFLASLINCNSNSNKDYSLRDKKINAKAPLILKITLIGNKTFKIPWDSLNWNKLEKDSTDFILFSLSTPFLKKKIFLKKDFIPLKTAFELSIKCTSDKYTLILNSYNYGSTHFEDSLTFLKVNDSVFLTQAYYIQHSLWNQNTICPYFLNSVDTISLEEKNINRDKCKIDFQETYILNILKQADYYWKENEIDSAKKYYRQYLDITTAQKIDSTLIPAYVYKRLH